MYYQDQFESFDRPNSYLSSHDKISFLPKSQQQITSIADPNVELCHQIKCIKNVKVGKKGDYKLLKQNVFNLEHCKLSYQRLRATRKNQSISIDNQDSISKRNIKLGKKISKKTKRYQKNSSQYSTSEGKSNSGIQQCENFDQNAIINKNLKLCSKGINLYQNLIKGGIGHSTLLFSQQITEGRYYLEFKIKPFYPLPGESQYIYKPEIRLGVSGPQHRLDTPLGIGKSIGFHLSKKLIITEGKQEQLSQINQQIFNRGINVGDIVGMLLDFSPPYKRKDNSCVWQDSSITYFVNGALLGKYRQVKQMFYHPALSLYNGASLELHLRDQQMIYKPQGSLSYDKIKQYINIYN